MDDQNLGQELEADGRTAVRFSAVLAWLQCEAVRHKDTGRFLEEFADLLLQAGVALFRVTIGIHIIHPQIDASRTLWQKGKPVTERRWKMDRQVVQNSPMATIYGGRIFSCSARWSAAAPRIPNPGRASCRGRDRIPRAAAAVLGRLVEGHNVLDVRPRRLFGRTICNASLA
jgi:hypothetical protein